MYAQSTGTMLPAWPRRSQIDSADDQRRRLSGPGGGLAEPQLQQFGTLRRRGHEGALYDAHHAVGGVGAGAGAAGCSTAGRRPAWRTRRTARSPGRSGSAAAGSRPARRSSAPPSSGGGPAAARLDPTSGDAHLDAPPRQVGAAAAMIVGLVRVALVGPAAPLARWRAHRREVVQQRRKHQAVVGVGPGHQQRQRSPLPSTARCSLDPGLARSTGFAPHRSPPLPPAG